jgi:hypothetical protein
MKTKNYVAAILAIVLSLTLISVTQAEPLTAQDKEQVKWVIGSFESYVNSGNVPEIVNLFSPNMDAARKQVLTDELYKKVASGGLKLEYFADLSDGSIKEIGPDIYEIKGKFKAQGPNWNVSGLSATFTLERVGGYFYVKDTNLFEKMGLEGVGKIVGGVFAVIAVIFFVFIGVIILIIVLIVRSQRKKKFVGTGGGPTTT